MKKFLFLILFPLAVSFAQIPISRGIDVTENFNSIGTAATAALPANWKADKNTNVRFVGSYGSALNATERIGGINLSSSASNGIYNFGLGDAASASDRAIGGQSSSSSSKSVNIYSHFINNGTAAITQADISYDVMRFRNGSNTAGFTIQLYYSTDGAVWSPAGSNFISSFSPNADNNGAPIVPIEKKQILNQTLSGISIPQNGSLYLAWNYSVTSGTTTSNAQALGIDNFAINNINGAATVPASPVAAAASDVTSAGFTASWSSTTGATSYLLDVSAASDFSNFVAGYNSRDAGNTTSASVSSLSPGTTYYYRVRGKNNLGNGEYSNTISVTTPSITTSVQFQGISDAVIKSAGSYELPLTIVNPDPVNATSCTVTFIPDSSTASASYLNNFSEQTVTFPAGSSENRKIVFTIVDNGIAEPAKRAFLQIKNVSGGTSAGAGALSKFKLSITSGTDNSYYTSIQPGLTGDSLKGALYNLIKTNIKFPYTDNSSASSIDVWKLCKAADEDPKNPDNVIGIYSGWSITKDPQDFWNREHVWSKSHGDFGTETGAGTDAHHLRPENPNINSLKSNLDFDNGGNPVPNAPGNRYDGDSWEPRDEVKGDIARMIFYMATRYQGNGEPDLRIVENIPSTTGTDPLYGKLSTLLQWNLQDPPDAFEMNRNNTIYYYQRNRNPFIDHPEWAASIWGTSTGIKENYGDSVPGDYFLYQNYPNPFNPETIISYSFPVDSHATLKVFDLLGREITTLVNGVQSAGQHRTTFSSQNSSLATGIYIYTLRAKPVSGGDEFTKSAKFLLVK
ncbi:MAG: endonuclease [Melioribacteraceae bacterium]